MKVIELDFWFSGANPQKMATKLHKALAALGENSLPKFSDRYLLEAELIQKYSREQLESAGFSGVIVDDLRDALGRHGYCLAGEKPDTWQRQKPDGRPSCRQMRVNGQTAAVIACSSSKAEHKCAASELYTGQLFKSAIQYCESHGIEFAILSAKHGLIMPWDEIEPYDVSLCHFSFPEKFALVRRTVDHAFFSVDKLQLELLCGHDYCEIIESALSISTKKTEFLVKRPLHGMGIGYQKQWLANHTRRIEVAA